MKRLLSLALSLTLLAGCARTGPGPEDTRWNAPPQPQQTDGVSLAYRAGTDLLQVYGENGWQDIYIDGVDIGAGKPGKFPGELGISYNDYYRWFGQISELGANAIRVYTILMPDFYNALYDYNAQAEKPLYFFQGVYNDEDLVLRYNDVFAGNNAVYDAFVSDIHDCIDVVHGNARLTERAGHASGDYVRDVSGWLMGWIIGIEFSADIIEQTNVYSPELTSYEGEYISIQDGSAFEVFMAMSLDAAVAYETENYAVQRPVAFVNWPTSDPLDHPDEADQEMENGPGIDEAKLIQEDAFQAGLFVSYHVYPYYPDYMMFSKMYLQDDPGNPYRGYLRTLKAHYGDLPVVITEIGQPSSRGMAHRDEARGFNQGNLNEKQQGENLVVLLDDIKAAGCGGGIIFTWQDEWFKRTWNAMAYDDPERRPYWSNVQTAEQNFGLLTFDPGLGQTVVTLDGRTREWEEIEPTVSYGGLEVKVNSDERYLYLLINTDKDFQLGFDINPDFGNRYYEGLSLGEGTDFIVYRRGEEAELLVDPYYYTTHFSYGYKHRSGFLKYHPEWTQRDNNVFVSIDMLMRRAIMLSDGEVIPTSTLRTGALRQGNGDPYSADFDSLADYCVGEGVTELRLPWALLNFSDPSTGEIIGDLYKDASTIIEGNTPFRSVSNIGVGLFDQGGNAWGRFYLANWDEPTYHERLKQSYYIVQDYWAGQR